MRALLKPRSSRAELSVLTFVFLLLSSVFGIQSAAAQTYQLLHGFDALDGAGPWLGGKLILDAAGNLYGTASSGAAAGAGVVFEMTPQGNGKWLYTILHVFNGKDGGGPNISLVFDKSGNLYGTSSQEGADNSGNVFELTPQGNGTWKYKVLHTFSEPDGNYPFGGVIFGSDGNLYGTTAYGGNNSINCPNGCGTIFKLTPGANGKWIFTVIYKFPGDWSHGFSPHAAVISDASGNLFGTTYEGGTWLNGVVFKLSRSANGQWTQHVLHSFHQRDGQDPEASVILDKRGNLYGTTKWGGSSGEGTVFKLSPGSNGRWTETVLHSFNGNDGLYPEAGLTLDTFGNLYGTTFYGGNFQACNTGCGVVFKLVHDAKGRWSEVVLHVFKYNDGMNPWGGLTLGTSGNLFGTTAYGGNLKACPGAGCGVVFGVAP